MRQQHAQAWHSVARRHRTGLRTMWKMKAMTWRSSSVKSTFCHGVARTTDVRGVRGHRRRACVGCATDCGTGFGGPALHTAQAVHNSTSSRSGTIALHTTHPRRDHAVESLAALTAVDDETASRCNRSHDKPLRQRHLGCTVAHPIPRIAQPLRHTKHSRPDGGTGACGVIQAARTRGDGVRLRGGCCWRDMRRSCAQS